MVPREDNPTPPRVLVAPTEVGIRVPSSLSDFPKAPMIIQSVMASIGTFEQKCDQNEPGASCGDNASVDDDVK
ncbi:hypothetical protein ElyMa_005266900, partial [Elysia marginata]